MQLTQSKFYLVQSIEVISDFLMLSHMLQAFTSLLFDDKPGEAGMYLSGEGRFS